MALYRGNSHWMYQVIKRKYIEIYSSTKGLMAFSTFKEKIESGSEFLFLGDSYKLNIEKKKPLIDKILGI